MDFRETDDFVRAAGRGTGMKGRAGKAESAASACRFRAAAAMFAAAGAGAACRPFPETAAAWLAAYPATSMLAPDSLWLCNNASGSLVDSIGSFDLGKIGSPSYRNLSDPLGRFSVALPTNSDNFLAASGTPMAQSTGANDGTTSIFARLMIPAAPAADSVVMAKGSNGAAGYRVMVLTDGSLRLDVNDIVAPTVSDKQLALAGNFCDGAWYDVGFWVDRLTPGGTIGLCSSKGTLVTDDLQVLGLDISSIGAATAWRQGGLGTTNAPGIQFSYVAAWYALGPGTADRILSLAEFNRFRSA